MNKILSKLNRSRLYLLSRESIGFKFKLVGVLLIMSAVGALATDTIEDVYVWGYNTSILIKILMALLCIEGILCLLFIDTKNFRQGYIGINMRNEMKLSDFDFSSLWKHKIKEYRPKTTKRDSEKLNFKPLTMIETLLKQNYVISPSYHSTFLSLLDSESFSLYKEKTEKIPLITLNEKQIFIYEPVFAFFNQVIEGGIYGLYGKSRKDLLRLITNNFSRNGDDFDLRNITNRYGEWLKAYDSNSCINYPLQ